MEETVAPVTESTVVKPLQEGGEVKEGRIGRAWPRDEALALKIQLAVMSRPIDFTLPDVQGD